MARFHQDDNGYMVPCGATKVPCPKGGAFHTDAEDTAGANRNREAWLREQNESPVVKKDPYAGKTMVSSATGAEFTIGEKFVQAGEEYYKATDEDGNEVTLAANNMGRFEEKAQPQVETPLEEARRELAEENKRIDGLEREIKSLDPKKDAEQIAELQAEIDESDWGHLDRKVAGLEEAERMYLAQESNPREALAQAEHEQSKLEGDVQPRSFTVSHDQDIADLAQNRESDFIRKAQNTEDEIRDTKAEIKKLTSDIEDLYPNQIIAARTKGDKEAFDKAQSEMKNAQMELQQQRSRLGILSKDKKDLKASYQEMSDLRKRYNDTRNPVMESPAEARSKHDELTRKLEHMRANIDDGAPTPLEMNKLKEQLNSMTEEISGVAQRNADKEHRAHMAKWRYEQSLRGDGKLSEVDIAQAELDYTTSQLKSAQEKQRQEAKLGYEYEKMNTQRALARDTEVWDDEGNVKNRKLWQELKDQEASTSIDAGENWRNYHETTGRVTHFRAEKKKAQERLHALKAEQSNLEKAVKANRESLAQKSKVEDGGSYSVSAINADREASASLDQYTKAAVDSEALRMDYAVNRDGVDKKTYLEKTIKGLEGEYRKVSADYDKHEARVDRIIEAEDENYDDQGEIIDRARSQRARDKIAQIRSENAENSARFNGLEKRLSFLRDELSKLAK